VIHVVLSRCDAALHTRPAAMRAGCYPVLHQGCQVYVIFAYLALYMLQVQHSLSVGPDVDLPLGSA